MLPGKKFTIDDVWRILRQRIWFLLVPTAIAAASVAMWSRGLPDMYYASTTILVVPQRISESIVRSTVETTVAERLPSIREAILSRTRLESVVEEFELYPSERATMSMEDIVEHMRDNIRMDVTSGRTDAFEIGYSGPDPVKVMQVTKRLADMTIDQSLSYRHNLARDTDDFLDSQLEDTRRSLVQQEQRLANYKATHAGELPTQVSSNLQQVASANARVQASLDAVTRSIERRDAIQKMLADLEMPGAVVSTATAGASAPTAPTGSTMDLLLTAQEAMASLEARGLKPGHPDLEAARRRVRDLTQRLESETRASTSAQASAPRPVSAAEAQRVARVSELRVELVDIERQILRARAEEQDARASASAAQARLDALPGRETDLIALTRDYGILEESYRELLTKREQVRISANLEERQVGEQFNIIDAPRLPERPYSPDRASLNLSGAGAGFAVGLALIALLEFRDRSFRTEEELAAVLNLPVLAVVPLMVSEADRRLEFVRRIGIAVACLAVVAGCIAVFFYAVAG